MEDVAGHTTQLDRIRAAVEEVLSGTELYLVEFDLRGRKGSQVLDVFVDADGALDVDRLAAVSRELGFLLETEEIIDGRYHLNVSSPGVERSLALPRQYPKQVGRTLRVSFRPEEGAPPETVVGELRSADADGIDLVEKGGALRRISYGAITDAHVQLPW